MKPLGCRQFHTVVMCVFFALITAIASMSAHLTAEAALGGRILAYGDASSSQCSLTDITPQVSDVFFIHSVGEQVDLVNHIEFRLAPSIGFTGVWLEDALPTGMTKQGSSHDGIVIFYNSCKSGDFLVLRARYQLSGTSVPCSYIDVVAYPGLDEIETADCSFERYPVDGARIFVNPDVTCPCATTVANDRITWGRVKALYRQ